MKINEKNLCVFATNPPYDREGFLSKRGEVNKAFQRRYFVLKGNLLFYFEKKGDKEPLGLIIVEGCTIELSEESDQYYCFEIAFNGNRTYVLSAESQESMESWMKALTCAGYEYKKLMVAELQRQLEEIEALRNSHKVTTPSSNPVPERPTRTNPFNRPAPAPPLPTHLHPKGPATQTPAIIDRPLPPPPPPTSTNNNNNHNTGPTPVPPTRRRPGTATVANGLVDASRDICLERQRRLSAQFKQQHEHFRTDIMRDIRNYRLENLVKTDTLIDLS